MWCGGPCGKRKRISATADPNAEALIHAVASPARSKASSNNPTEDSQQQVEEVASSAGRAKLSYLLDMKPSKGAVQAAAEVSQPTIEEDASQAEQLVPAEGQEQCDAAVLGFKSVKCRECGSTNIEPSRFFIEQKVVYCSDCWSSWDRSGWWRPSIRVHNSAPVLGSSGLPEYGPADAFSVPAFLCECSDLSLFEKLRNELPTGKDFIDWHGSRHMGIQFQGEGARHDGDDAPPVLRATVARMEAAFGIQAAASRLNLYRDSKDYKPFHYDRGRDDNGVPQVTVGASFGATRELTFVHVASGVTMTFPQRNGDVFAFTPELNNVFMHGVPKLGFNSPAKADEGPRLSLILWGRRVTKESRT